MAERDAPRTTMPVEFHLGPIVIPTVYVRIAAAAVTIAVIWLIITLVEG